MRMMLVPRLKKDTVDTKFIHDKFPDTICSQESVEATWKSMLVLHCKKGPGLSELGPGAGHEL